MELHPNWPYLSLLARNLFDGAPLGPAADYGELDVLTLDRQESQLTNWLSEVAGQAALTDYQLLREKVKITRFHRDSEQPDISGRQPWYNNVYVYDGDQVLVEEILSDPLNEDLTVPSMKMSRYSRTRFKDCPQGVKRLFPDLGPDGNRDAKQLD